jgi:iron complex outermembrane recepter protein
MAETSAITLHAAGSRVRAAVRSLCDPKLIGGVALATLFALPLQAADTVTANADTDAEGQQLQEVVVTGSHLKTTETESSSPVQVVTEEQIHQSGYTSIQDVLHDLTANGQGTLSQSFGGAFASGGSGVALRGLTVGATLVLINGHRTAPYPIGDDGERSFTDISNLPFDAIERVEVLKDGASAIYGSDAIAGVVNVITKKSYQGFTATADGGLSSHNDGGTMHFSATGGLGDLDNDGHNAYLSLEFRNQGQIKFADRGNLYTQHDYTSTGGTDYNFGAQNSVTGSTPRSAYPGYVTDTAGNVAGFFPGCNATSFAANQCVYGDNWSQIQPRTQNVNALLRATQKLGDNWQIDFDGGFFQSRSQQIGNPSRAWSGGYQGIVSGPGVVPSLTPTLDPTTISATNPSFPTGTGLTTANLYHTFLDVGATSTDTRANTYRAVVDLDGKALGWDIEASVGYTEVALRLDYGNTVNPYLLQDALDSTTNPYLVNGPNSQSVINSIAPLLEASDTSKLAFAHAGASRALFNLPGGPFQFAFGGDWYVRDQNAVAPALVAAGDYANQISNNFTVGTQHEEAGYAEINAPIVKMFDVDAAIRYDNYSLSGGRASPKVGFKFTPFDQLAFRGTASKGFRAPGPAENGRAGQTFFAGSLVDPILCPNSAVTTAPGNFAGQCNVQYASQQGTNPKLSPETSKSWTLGLVVQPLQNLSATFDFYSIEIDNQIIAGGPTTLVRGTNLSPIPQYQADGTTALVAPPVGTVAYQSIGYINANTTKTNGFDLALDYKWMIGSLQFKSEATWSYMSTYKITIDGSKYELAGTHGPFIISGDTGNPKSRVEWSNTVGQNNWSVTGTVNYISAFSLTDPSAVGFGEGPQGNCLEALQNGDGLGNLYYADPVLAGNIPSGISCSVGHFIDFDIYARYDVSKQLSVHASVLNAFNEKAPADWETYGGGNAPYDPSLHTQGAIGPFFNLGVTFKL